MNWQSILSSLAVVVVQALVAPAAEPNPPRAFQSDGRDLISVKRRLATDEPSLVAAVAELYPNPR